MCGPGECGRSTSRAEGTCEPAAPDEALRTIRPDTGGFTARRLRRSPPRHVAAAVWENANGSLAAALYPYSVIVFDSVVGVHALASNGDIFGCIVSKAFGDGVLSSGDAFLGKDSISFDEVTESSGCTFCLDTEGLVRSTGVDCITGWTMSFGVVR